jgi:tryptophanyl-tRNA synthetase
LTKQRETASFICHEKNKRQHTSTYLVVADLSAAVRARLIDFCVADHPVRGNQHRPESRGQQTAAFVVSSRIHHPGGAGRRRLPTEKGPPTMRVLSGIQPSGSLHLGNYFGMMKKMIEYQQNEELFCFIANYHAMTSVSDGKVLAKGTIEAAANFLALGMDPEKSTFWVQSDLPEVQELTWFLSNFTPMGLLERCHSFKDKIARGIAANHGLFAYPVLMAADILMFQSDKVPVGKDQKQHVEVTRDIALKVNNLYGELFVIPEPEIDDEVATVPGLDGQKMSKSYGNTIELFLEEKALRKQVMRIVTDPTPVEEPKDPDTCNVFQIYRLFLSKDQEQALRRRYLAGGLGYGEVKEELFVAIRDFFAPYAERRAELLADPDGIRAILARGSEKARYVATKTMRKVRKKSGLAY